MDEEAKKDLEMAKAMSSIDIESKPSSMSQSFQSRSSSTTLSVFSSSDEEDEEEVVEFEDIHPISTLGMHEISRTTSRRLSRTSTQKSRASSSHRASSSWKDPDFRVDWTEGDAEDPRNWSGWKKARVVFGCTLSSAVCVIYSSAYISGVPRMMIELEVKNETLALLGLTTYLLGFAAGALLWAPLSETFGRRPVYLATLSSFLLFILACALARNLETMLVARFFAGMLGCSSMSNSPGSINDVIEPKNRAFAFSFWGLGVMNGPVLGPLFGGFAEQYLGWRWIHYISLIMAAVAFLCILAVPETFKPALVRRRTASLRKESGDERWWSEYDEECGLRERLRIALSRPFSLTFHEPILWFWDFFIMVVYAIVYLYFVLYPKVFQGLHGWSSSISGLSYLGIGLGTLMTVLSEPWLRHLTSTLKLDPATNIPAPESKVAIVCGSAVLMPIGAFWFAWTCDPGTGAQIHWIVPILSGIPFGAGTTGAFIYGCNYVAQSYGSFATSALAGNVVVRCVAGATLPLAGPRLWDVLGPKWTGTLLGGLELLILPVPFLFYRYGHLVRGRSRFAC